MICLKITWHRGIGYPNHCGYCGSVRLRGWERRSVIVVLWFIGLSSANQANAVLPQKIAEPYYARALSCCAAK
jgi:hypothetical protein